MPRKARPVLLALQTADCASRLAVRQSGPKAARSMLSEGSQRIEITPDGEALARDHIDAVNWLPDELHRRVLSLAIETKGGCKPRRDIRKIAAIMGMPRATCHRLLHRALDAAEIEFAARETRMAA